MNLIKKIIKSTIQYTASFFCMISSSNAFGRLFLDQIINQMRDKVLSVNYKTHTFKFSSPNSLNVYRINTFSTKEPETLDWIDEIPEGSVLWDVGANIGLYSCYAAKVKKCRVYAFEPSVLNLELLARNIFLNELTQAITIVPLPLNDELSISTLNMTTMEMGGALSSFGKTYGHDGADLNVIFAFSTIGLSIVDATKLLKIDMPDYIKIDVDGIEALILKGGHQVLSKIKGVLIEINEGFSAQHTQSNQYLTEAGLTLSGKFNADKEDANSQCYNQVWLRNKA